jgi:hypothetical protein
VYTFRFHKLCSETQHFVVMSLITFLLTYSLHEVESFMRIYPVFNSSRNSSHFMEPEGSLPQSQVANTCPYPEPARSSLCPTSHFLKIHLNIILPSTPGSPKWLISLRFPHQSPVYASPLLHTSYIPHPSHSLVMKLYSRM